MKDDAKAGIKEIEIEMVIRDKNGRIKSIDHEVATHGNTR